MPIQLYLKFYHTKKKKKNNNKKHFHIKNSDILHISAQNIDCVYSLELPQRVHTIHVF